MNNFRFVLTSLVFLLSCTGAKAGETGNEIIENLRLGMTEAEVNEHYPDGKMSLAGADMTVEGRYASFRRGDDTFEDGLTMFKIRPANTGSKETCGSFFDTIKPKIAEQFGDPTNESASNEAALTVSEAAWEAPGLAMRLESIWYEDPATCSAELFVRPTDIEPL